MTWKPRVVALDLDGTVVQWIDGVGQASTQVSPAVVAAVRAAYDAGATIALCSGRSALGMINAADLLGLPDEGDRIWLVVGNGSTVMTWPPLEAVHETTFDAGPVVAEILQMHPDALVAVQERGVGYRLNGLFPPGELIGEMRVVPLDELLAQPVDRVIVRDPGASVEDFVRAAERLGLHDIEYVVGFTAWMDIAAAGVNKASGLAYVCREIGVDAADVLAMGDGRNDVEMLQWAGRGVAMGNALPEAIAAADAVTASCEDDGVAVELRRWFPA
ncbi:hydrolase [Nocardioides baekrokdamisoli]|uniref:Hydrolase n=1 Tax=Nocardioides baekrokdamisoli TaxID=1804624 RepID=A0A3G9J110_9ACTN|nr:HAD family hydrolase [Nocardioides baekrokdamisoli]BBH17318.1 hydrolase [Nocardioides baekrokdamisoli]